VCTDGVRYEFADKCTKFLEYPRARRGVMPLSCHDPILDIKYARLKIFSNHIDMCDVTQIIFRDSSKCESWVLLSFIVKDIVAI
jgi:hypothetical protein